jgi:hypothetical protein
MAGLYGSDVVPPGYRSAVIETLRAFYRLTRRRADRATIIIEGLTATDPDVVEPEWTEENLSKWTETSDE